MKLPRFALQALSPVVLCAVLCVAASLPPSLAAQATSPYSKTLDVYAYAGYLNSNPTYGPYRNSGGALGLQVVRDFPHIYVTPSLEARIGLTNGPDIKETTYLGGLNVQHTYFSVLHPYADFLIGYGTVGFNFTNPNGYEGDNSIVKSYGGGLNVDVTPSFAVKADYQYQSWTLGINNTLSPTVLLFGVTYHLPFKPLVDRQGDLKR